MYNRSASSRASIRSFLFPCLLFFRGSHTTSFVTCGLSRSYNQVAQVPSSKVTCNSPRSPWIKSRMTFAFVSITHSITSFPASFLTAIEMLSLCTSMPIYLVPVIKGRSFLEGFEPNTQNLTPKGRPFYIASCQLNRSMQHFAEVYWRGFEILRFFLDADLTAAPLGPDPFGCNPIGRFS